MLRHPKHPIVLFTVFLVLLLIGTGLFWYSTATAPSPLPSPTSFEPYRTTLTGTYLCLPHTDTSGPQTLECALGLQTDEGHYYALDFNLSSTTPPNIPTGSRVTGNGILTPIEHLSTSHWRIYPLTGIFSVTDSFREI